jgi:diguanylate cyclase (GGDEF)-like protein
MLSMTHQNLHAHSSDTITGFLNRAACFNRISQLARQATPNRRLFVIWIALDRFKLVNESFGHQGGDVLIFQIASRLKDKTDACTSWFRVAGDEFVLLSLTEDPDHAERLAAVLLDAIQAPLPLNNLTLRPSASLGVATLEANELPHACLERADHAMKSAKRAGGSRIVTSGKEPIPGRLGIRLAHDELEIENKLHIAIEQGELSLHYQPIIAADGSILSVEALMRSTSQRLAPAEFIPIAEKTGLIIRLGEWSLLEGANFARRLQESGECTTVSINISRAQFSMPHFPQTLHAALLCANVDPQRVELELTESLFMDNSSIVQINLRATKDTGVKISIDDFGTGFSCLATLKDIHASKLKIDRAFVVALPQDKRAFSVVSAIARLGRDLGMLVVAEGVENHAQIDALLEAGVHAIQGYIHARPMPEDTLLKWVRNRK